MNLLRYVRETLVHRLWAIYKSEVKHTLTIDKGFRPTTTDFKKVEAFNELLAWSLAFGRRPNHFCGVSTLQALFLRMGIELLNSLQGGVQVAVILLIHRAWYISCNALFEEC